MKGPARLLAAITRDRETNWRFAIVAGVLYAAFLTWAHAHHEFWRDEIHPWTIARLADGFGDLVTGDRVYEGHPPLWFWYLRVFSWFTDRAVGLHAANVVAMGAAALLFFRFAPFPRFIKVLTTCSYILGYEYGVLTRNYSLDWLLVVAFCTVFHPLRLRFWCLSLILCLLCIGSAYGAVLAPCFFLALLGASAFIGWRGGLGGRLEFAFRPEAVGACALLLVALGLSYLSAIPPDPNPFSPGWDFAALKLSAIPSVLEKLVYTFLPVREFGDQNVWTIPWTFWGGHETLRLFTGILLVALLCGALVPAWPEVIALLSGLGMMAFLQTTRYGGALRHWGHALMLFVGLAWIARRSRPGRKHYLSSFMLVLIGAFQLESFLVAVGVDRRKPFSGGEEAAAFIERAGMQDLPIVAGPDWFVVTVTGYLRRVFISVETEEIDQTVVFHGRRRPFSPERLVARAADLCRKRRGPVLLVSTDLLPAPDRQAFKMRLLFSGQKETMIGEERFFVYRISE